MIPELPDSTEAMTNEELFIATGIKNKTMHAKAKMYIMDMLN